jgi:hypothetical protein
MGWQSGSSIVYLQAWVPEFKPQYYQKKKKKKTQIENHSFKALNMKPGGHF